MVEDVILLDALVVEDAALCGVDGVGIRGSNRVVVCDLGMFLGGFVGAEGGHNLENAVLANDER